ncbi:type IX secretion system sortase PorU [Tenacibaculum sp. M341]|uniref:type IX secretion system sortase PorU n=1 Tax=Tenacibaculum sp. M341 TaxID=2530339 RepID=UPI0010498827|nr:type IX secretion system sortase PorU [Tenacibaculum sp. M341]TCI91755.1 type IX secretion system sortase PorU [Tenacibaculum sp. M341]
MRKKSLYILFFFTLIVNSQSKNSVLSNGNWYKFAINTTGVFKLDRNFLSELGINVNNINPKDIKIYGNGGHLLPELASNFRHDDLVENAIFVQGEDDNVFNDNDFILFYGIGPHSWTVNITNETAVHNQNIYSDRSYYFLTVNSNPSKRISNSTPLTGTSTVNINEYDDFQFYENEEVNLLALGRLWMGESFNVNSNLLFKIPFDNAVAGSNANVTVSAVAQSSTSSTMNIVSNGTTLPTMGFTPVPSNRPGNQASLISSRGNITATNEIEFQLNYNNNGNPSAKAYLDYIEVIGKKRLTTDRKQFTFRSFIEAKSSGIVDYSINNTANIFGVWNVTDPLNPISITDEDASDNNFAFKTNGGSLKEYVFLDSNDFYSPIQIPNRIVSNQNLHGLTNIDYLVITSSEFINEAERLTNYHQTNSNLNTKVVNLSEIYNEFGSGSPDIVAIRDFIKYLHDNSSTRKLRYVCFFGDSSYDFKDRISNNNNIVPTYHAEESFHLVRAYVTDDFFVMISDNDGFMNPDDKIDIASGRIPISTTQEANEVVNKILSYYSADSFGDWRNNITLVADDIDADSDRSLQTGIEEIADDIKINKPILNINKIYLDAFKQENSSGGERYPDAKTAVTNSIEKGTLLFNYFGHGGEDGLATERILEVPQIRGFNNPNKLPLFITVTCDFSRFDNPLRNTAGEQLFLNANGGAVSMITTTREVFISTGEVFNRDLTKYVLDYNNSDDSIAENLIKAKNETTTSERFFIYFFGDPAMRLAIPKPDVRIQSLNGNPISGPTDVLKALSKVQVEGAVTDASGNILSDYNGTIFTTFFDKPIDKTTLDNDGFGVINTFDSQESKIFRGKSSVNNGIFNLEFIVPKDIKIAVGKGKFSFYAQNEKVDTAGVNFDIDVGGIDENAPEDNIGPEIQPFMNDESFIDGGQTNTSPNLIVKLSDSSGINTSITAIDHDIVAILDGNEASPIILNDFYETELNDFTKGTVSFQLRDLSVGKHTIKIKAWDTYNNSSEATLSFEVTSDTKLLLNNVLNYPNPFTNYTEFWFNHNKPNEPLEVQVQVFTVSGKLVKTLNQTVQTTGGLSRSISWNGMDDFGNKIGKGVYLYKIKVTSMVNKLSSEKYEKLVIL